MAEPHGGIRPLFGGMNDGLQATSAMTTKDTLFRIIVPTLNSSEYIGDILLYYKLNNLQVTVLVDMKSTDQTRDLAANLFEVVDMDNETNFIENVIGEFSKKYHGEWILRIDDDELPSIEMIKFIEAALSDDRCSCYDVFGFARHQCLASYEGKLISHTGHDAFADHRQWRLYNPDRMRFHRALHTAGFDMPEDRMCHAPDDACMIHLDWIVHSYAERRDKLARYDAVQPGVADRDRAYYLVEEAGARVSDLLPLHLPEFDDTVRRLSAKARRRRYASWNWSLPC